MGQTFISKTAGTNMKFVTVLDLNTCTSHIYPAGKEEIYYENKQLDLYKFLKERGHKLSECSYMVSENVELTIED